MDPKSHVERSDAQDLGQTESPRGFERPEYEARMRRAQSEMTARQLDAVVVTAPPNWRYFAGFATQFWESPTRPWFLVLPRLGEPIAVIPTIGEPGIARTWVADIRTWPAPRAEDDGVSLMAQVLGDLPRKFGRIGWEMGRESIIRMPIADFDRIRAACSGIEFADASPLIWRLRMVKSPAEVAKIGRACQIGSRAYAALPAQLSIGMDEHEVARLFRAELIRQGADAIPFMAVTSGAGGYDQIIVGPVDRTMADGDVLFIDLGCTFDGYFCDFDRNFAIGRIDDETKRVQDIVWRATEAGIAAARPGATPADLAAAMVSVMSDAGATGGNVGRLGHGLGLQLTEPPSNMPGETVVLEPGMVMTIEPGMDYGQGKMLVHEENVVITEDGCRLLTTRAPREMWQVG
jgi:Xaa-Pro aminopeptidase